MDLFEFLDESDLAKRRG